MLKKLLTLLLVISLVSSVALFTTGCSLFGGDDFLESDLIGEGDGENVSVETKEEMVELYKSTALPLINNLTKGADEESEYDSLTVTLQTNMPGKTYAKNMGLGSDAEGEINQYVLFAITEDVMYVKISTDSTVEIDSQDLTFTSVAEYYITEETYYVRVASFEGSSKMLRQQKMAYAQMGEEMGDAFELLFDGDLKEEWVDVEGTEFGSTLIDQGVLSCYTALAMLGSDVDEADFVDGETPELTMEINGSTNIFQFKFINNTVVEELDADDVEVLSEYLD